MTPLKVYLVGISCGVLLTLCSEAVIIMCYNHFDNKRKRKREETEIKKRYMDKEEH